MDQVGVSEDQLVALEPYPASSFFSTERLQLRILEPKVALTSQTTLTLADEGLKRRDCQRRTFGGGSRVFCRRDAS